MMTTPAPFPPSESPQTGEGAEFWHILHDGEITSVSGEIPGIVELRVEIEYLAKMFAPDAKAVIVTLHGCTRFEVARKGGPVTKWPEARASAQEATIRRYIASQTVWWKSNRLTRNRLVGSNGARLDLVLTFNRPVGRLLLHRRPDKAVVQALMVALTSEY